MTRFSNHKRAFCVVQFIELPFEGIDDYVCVPYTWVAVVRAKDQKAVVAYPKDEDPFDTRDRVKRKEMFDDKWRFYMAAVKYESDTYRDAEYWIATRNDYGPLVEEESRITDAPPRFTLNKKLRSVNQSHSSKSNENLLPRISIKRPALSEAMKELDGKRFKLSKSAQSSSDVVNDATAEPGCSRWGQSIIIQDNQSIECAQTKETAAASNGESNSSQRPNVTIQESIPMQEQEELDMPLMDADTPTVVFNDGKEVQPSSIMEQHLAKQLEPVQEPRISVASSVEMTGNDQALPTNDALNSLKMSAHLYSHMNGARRLVPIQKPVEKKIRLMNIENNLDIATQNPSCLMKETESSSTRSVTEQSSVITQNSLQDGPRVLKMHTGNSSTPLRNIAISSQEIKHVPKINDKTSHDVAAVDPRSVLQSDNNIASASQNLPSSSHERPSFVRRLAEHQSSQAQEQYLPHSNQNQYLSTNPDNFGQDQHRGSTESKNDDHRPNSRTVSKPSIRQNSEQPSHPMYPSFKLPKQRQSQSNQQDSQRQPQRPEIRINISIKPKNNRKIPTLQGVTKRTPPPILTKVLNSIRQALSTTHNEYLLNDQQLQASQSETVIDNEGLRNVMDDTRQANECMEEEPLSPYPDNEISTDEAPVETTNNSHCTGITSGIIFAGRPTAAQNSTSPNHQTHPRVVLEQQMLDNFATLFTQMGSTLRYTCDMYHNLRSSIRETAVTYRNLLDEVERFNTLVNSASNPSPSNHLTPEIPQATEERHTEVTERADSSNQDQDSNDVAN